MKRNGIYYLGYIACIVAAGLALWCIMARHEALSTDVPADFQMTYALVGEIVEIDRSNDMVAVQDYNGNMWAFTGTEDWMVGDTCAMVMSDNGTDTIYDDTIESVRYQAWEISQ